MTKYCKNCGERIFIADNKRKNICNVCGKFFCMQCMVGNKCINDYVAEHEEDIKMWCPNESTT